VQFGHEVDEEPAAKAEAEVMDARLKTPRIRGPSLLCGRFGVKTTTARTGKFRLVAAALFGDPDVDLQYYCMKAISQKPAQK
jgi:hypothetical protein